MAYDLALIKKQAEEELRQEEFRRAVDNMKEKLKARRTFWDRIWPWKIVVIRKDNPWTS